jgi:polysaccharide biosynthesis/export protein
MCHLSKAGILSKHFGQVSAFLLALLVLACPATRAQDKVATQNQDQNQGAIPGQLSDLARQNMSHVAASAADIKLILQRDSGLMVALKEWIAKDATEHGQLVSDADLTDQAIYDRLDTDVEFRSVATQLLQKYGYLLPQINPESPQAKQQELLLQERTKMVVQGEEEAQAREHQAETEELEAEEKLAKARNCDPRVDSSCSQEPGTVPSNSGGLLGIPSQPGLFPRTLPPNGSQMPPIPQLPFQTLEQTQYVEPNPGFPLGMSGTQLGGSFGGMSPQLGNGLGSSSGLLGTSSSFGGFGEGGATSNPFAAQQMGGQGAFGSNGLGLNSTNPLQAELFANGGAFGGMQSEEGLIPRTSETYLYNQRDLFNLSQPYAKRMFQPVSLSQGLVPRPDPYTEIPSLYDMYLQAMPQPPALERFGMEVFQNGTRDLQMIPMDVPVGPDYTVGPGDGLAIDLWGSVSRRIYGVVDREGRLNLPEAGPVLVAGKSLADVQQAVQQTLRTQFRDVSADVSLARLRTIRVYVVGDVDHPGAYDISGLSTPLNALFSADGPTAQGSLRVVNHYRGNQLVQTVDLYDLLLRGVKSDIQRLENGDTVQIPPIGPQVTVEGMVRRPAIYELRDEKNLADVLSLAGGLLPTATLRHIEVQRIVAHDKRTMLSIDIPADASSDSDSVTKQLESFQVQDGDKIRIFPIAPFNQDTVYLEGHVIRPGRYSYHPGMKVTDLIASYKDLLPEPSEHYAEIIRLNAPDYHPSVESFDLEDALKNPASAPVLDPLDTVQVFGRYDFENPPTVSIWGDVRDPGTYRTSGEIHLSDAIHMAGGVAADAELQDAQVFRYLPNGESKIFNVDLAGALSGNPTDNIVLSSRDRILIHQNPADVSPATVYITGEVARPGRYPLTSNMEVSDLIRAAGGLQLGADLESADLTHYQWNGQAQITGVHEEVALGDAMSGNSTADISVTNGDVLTVRQKPGWNDLGASITVRGEVTHPGSYGIRPGERLSSILRRAGGFAPEGYPYGAILERSSVRDVEEKSQQELVQRIEGMQADLKFTPTADSDEAAAKAIGYQQWHTALETLSNNQPVGRVTIQISSDIKNWANTPRDIAVRAGDILIIPKRPSYVMVEGQVYSPTAVSFRPGRSAKWYLSQAGGATNLANKKAIFVIRADGTVIGGHGAAFWDGGALSESLQPGDQVVVPEKALGGPPVWKSLFQNAQILSSIATAVVLAANY